MMKKDITTVTIPLATHGYEVSVRQVEAQSPNGTDIVCADTLRCNGKPVAAVAPKRRTVHYAEDIPAACRQVVSEFEAEVRKFEAKDSPQKNAAAAVEESPLEEGIRRIRESGIVIYPKNGNRGWNPRTQAGYLAVFCTQVAPFLQPYAHGEKPFLPSDLDALENCMKAEKAKNARSNGRAVDLAASTRADLAAADIIYRFVRDAYPDLGLPELALAPFRKGSGARKEQEKSLPEPVRQKLCRYVETRWRQEPRLCYALTLMLCGGLRTAEAAGTRPEKIEYAEAYGVVKVHAQEKEGKIDKILKRDSSYRGVVLGCWGCNILRQCADEMRKNDPNWENDETAPVCLAQGLSAWTLARLRECGVDEAFLATARKRYEEETIYGKDGNPTEDFSAYILRRDWASRARNICGYTSVEIDLQLGHKVDTPRYKRPNLKLAAEQEKLAAKAERYVYSLVGTQNPEYTPILLQAGDRKEIPTFKTVKYCNGSDKPVLVAITFDAMENADAVQLTAPCGAMRKTAFTSRPDDPNQRRNRPIIGRQKEEK